MWDGGKWACRFFFSSLISAEFVIYVFWYFIKSFQSLFVELSADSAAAVR